MYLGTAWLALNIALFAAYFAIAQALELEPEWPGARVRVAMWQVVLAKKVYKEAMAERFETWVSVGR